MGPELYLAAAALSMFGGLLGFGASSSANHTNKQIAMLNYALQQQQMMSNEYNVASTNMANRSMVDATNEMNRYLAQMNNQFNLASMREQNQFNASQALLQFQRELQMNDPSFMVRRLLSAGLNPSSAFGDASYGSAQAASGAAPAQASEIGKALPGHDEAFQSAAPQIGFHASQSESGLAAINQLMQGLGSAVDSTYNILSLDKRLNEQAEKVANMKADTKTKQLESANLELARQLFAATFNNQVEAAGLNNELIRAKTADFQASQAQKEAQTAWQELKNQNFGAEFQLECDKVEVEFKKLANDLKIAQLQKESAIYSANTMAAASRYSADKSLEASQYSADKNRANVLDQLEQQEVDSMRQFRAACDRNGIQQQYVDKMEEVAWIHSGGRIAGAAAGLLGNFIPAGKLLKGAKGLTKIGTGSWNAITNGRKIKFTKNIYGKPKENGLGW